MGRRTSLDPLCDVYLLHFTVPYHRARHYIGSTRRGRVETRLAEHRAGRGARLCRQALAVGSELVLARVWEGVPLSLERELKQRRGAAPFCPICRGEMIIG